MVWLYFGFRAPCAGRMVANPEGSRGTRSKKGNIPTGERAAFDSFCERWSIVNKQANEQTRGFVIEITFLKKNGTVKGLSNIAINFCVWRGRVCQ